MGILISDQQERAQQQNYQVAGDCVNCNTKVTVLLPKGTPFQTLWSSARRCPNCGCHTVYKS